MARLCSYTTSSQEDQCEHDALGLHARTHAHAHTQPTTEGKEVIFYYCVKCQSTTQRGGAREINVGSLESGHLHEPLFECRKGGEQRRGGWYLEEIRARKCKMGKRGDGRSERKRKRKSKSKRKRNGERCESSVFTLKVCPHVQCSWAFLFVGPLAHLQLKSQFRQNRDKTLARELAS
jgi:hypothetical protein